MLFDITVLYVEDENVLRTACFDFFKKIFTKVIVAVDGEDGLLKYKEHHNHPKPIDFVITDITMPNLNGFQMVEELRKINEDLHVVVTSALDFGNYLDEMNRISLLNQYIKKPVDFTNFVPLVEKILGGIAKRKEYRKEYSLSKQYQNALDNSAIVTKTDRFGIITYANDAFCKISGYKKEELIGKSHNIVRDPSVSRELFKDLWRTIQAKMVYKHESIPNKAKNGDIYYVNTTILPILNENREIEEYISIRFDTTALEVQLRADKKALQSQEKFLANMSHEIRTPLNGILGFAKILQEQITDPELKEYADVINHSGKNLLSLINQILDLSKVQNGHMELDKTWISLYGDITAIKKLYDINAKEKQIDLQCNLCSNSSDNILHQFELFIDALKIKQVISNLLSNAIKFTPKGGCIVLEVKRVALNEKKIKLRFSVKDTGIGIAKEKQAQIFEPFKQADLSTTREYGGTGLGLALAKDFVKLFGSELKVESEINKGSEFSFEAEFEYRKIEMKNELIKEKFILLAEDVQINQKLTEIILKDIDAKILVAENGREAVELFQKDWDRIDAVLLDIKMPVMDGLEACKRINQFKETNNIKDIPIIALTGDDSLKEKEKYISLGFDLFISKPINEEILKSALKKLSKRTINQKIEISNRFIDDENEMKRLDNLQLPKDIANEVLKDPNPKTDPNSVLKGTILVAEDVPVNQKLIGIILKKFGLDVVFTNNGLEAVSYFMKEYKTIDAVLLDINMPVMDGMEACARISVFKKLNAITNIPVIALTANAISGDKERYLRMGFDQYLAKPIDNEKLFDVLKNYLQIENKIVNKEEISPIITSQKKSDIKIDFETNANKLSLPFEFYQELLEDFCKLLEKEIPKLSEAIKEKDSNSIKEIAHKLKGVAGNLAINQLFVMFKTIEDKLNDKKYDEIIVLFEEINSIIKGSVCLG